MIHPGNLPKQEHFTPPLDEVRARITGINRWRSTQIPDPFSAISEVVVVASSSRGGSSIFTEILRRSPDLLHCKGEINPFLTLAGLNREASGNDSDNLPVTAVDPANRVRLAALEQEIALDLGVNQPVDLREPTTLARFHADLHWRLTCQWTGINLEKDFLYTSIDHTLAQLQQNHGWPEGAFPDPQLFHLLLLNRLRNRYPAINPWYYDIAPSLIRDLCPEARINPAPPGDLVIEEPPFVTIAPNRPVTAALLSNRPLILKTPSNVYRLPFLQALFPRARFRVIHLVRHPADAINGLVDGWLYHGFFSHHLPDRLRIKGYSDRFPNWGRSWWKYDLPQGWQDWTDHSLPKVCGFQWQSAHRATLNFLAESGVDHLRVRFEEALGTPGQREQTMTAIGRWLGIDPQPLIMAATGELPPVMATCRPRHNRWFRKAALLRPVLNDKNIRQLANNLGYDLNHDHLA
ncbi:MAG: sulfotransferase [Proteobacteria bacterium]|nr:sulfotransferase [Pseudomonadota bacterium]MBU1686167.1 sulfotransferase [Pseudomonadota bacterium]